MPWVLPKPSESGYTLGNQNFWNQMQSTIQLMQGVIGTLPALYKLFQEARAIGDNAAANAILLRINELAASLPRTPLGTIATTAGQLAAHQNLAGRGYVGRDVYWRYLHDLFARQIPYSQVFPRPISQEDDPNFVSIGGFLFPRELVELLRMESEIRRAEAEMQAAEDLEKALEELPPDVRQEVRIAGPPRRPSLTERLEGVDPSNQSGARIMRSLSGDRQKQQRPANVGGVWLSPELMWFLQNRDEIMRSLQGALPEQTPGGTGSERVPSGMSLEEHQYLMWLREQLNRWRQEP
jgi:hypothetical protein